MSGERERAQEALEWQSSRRMTHATDELMRAVARDVLALVERVDAAEIRRLQEFVTADEIESLRERVAVLEAALQRMERAYRGATNHITKDLQPEFARLANDENLTWPRSWSDEYDESRAANRLATWWHGAGDDSLFDEARAALRDSPPAEGERG
jgi:hypothetical protein